MPAIPVLNSTPIQTKSDPSDGSKIQSASAPNSNLQPESKYSPELTEMIGESTQLKEREFSSKGAIIQRVRIFDENVSENLKAIITTVVNSDPLLRAMWSWLMRHTVYEFTITVVEGSNATVAVIRETAVSLKINRDDSENNPNKLYGTIGHELHLHMMPWVRLNMVHELDKYGNNYDQELLPFARTVIGPIASDQNTLDTHRKADIANKTSASPGGNHSDLALWTNHLNEVWAILQAEQNAEKKSAIIESTVRLMAGTMGITGHPIYSIDRGKDIYPQFLVALQNFIPLKAQIIDEQRRNSYDGNIAAILNRAKQYESTLGRPRE